MRRRGTTGAALVLAVPLLLAAPPAVAGGRTVTGAVVKADAAARTLSVRDGMGVSWNFVVDRDAGIDLAALSPGDRVRVTVRRATPLNMVTAADRVRRGDRVERLKE